VIGGGSFDVKQWESCCVVVVAVVVVVNSKRLKWRGVQKFFFMCMTCQRPKFIYAFFRRITRP